MVNIHETVTPIELDSESDPKIDLNLVESSKTEEQEEEEEVRVQNELVTTSCSEAVSLKRASTEEKESQAKKQKQQDQSERKQLFQKLWSEADDEIVILKGMIDYADIKKVDPVADLNAFRDFIKKDVHFEFSGSQLKNKIKKLRTKYKNHKRKEKKGKIRTFSNPHKQEAYELSEKVWNHDGKKALGDSWSTKYKENKKGGKTAQAAERWKRLKIKEIEAYMARLEAKIAEVKMVLDHLKTAVL